MAHRTLSARIVTALLLSAFLLGCVSPEAESGSETPSNEAAQTVVLPVYEIVDEETSDTPIKTQVELNEGCA